MVVEAEVEPVALERAFMLSANTTGDLERAFASIRLGELPERPPLMLAFPSALEDGWTPPGRAALWLSTFVPWRLAAGPWDRAALERAAAKALGSALEPVERELTGPWSGSPATATPHANPNPRRDEPRPAPVLPPLAQPVRLPGPDRRPVPDRRRHPPRRRRHRHPRPQRRRRRPRHPRHLPPPAPGPAARALRTLRGWR